MWPPNQLWVQLKPRTVSMGISTTVGQFATAIGYMRFTALCTLRLPGGLRALHSSNWPIIVDSFKEVVINSPSTVTDFLEGRLWKKYYTTNTFHVTFTDWQNSESHLRLRSGELGCGLPLTLSFDTSKFTQLICSRNFKPCFKWYNLSICSNVVCKNITVWNQL